MTAREGTGRVGREVLRLGLGDGVGAGDGEGGGGRTVVVEGLEGGVGEGEGVRKVGLSGDATGSEGESFVVVVGVELEATAAAAFANLAAATPALTLSLSQPLLEGRYTLGAAKLPFFNTFLAPTCSISSLDAARAAGVFPRGGSHDTGSTTLMASKTRLKSFTCLESIGGRRVREEEGSRTG